MSTFLFDDAIGAVFSFVALAGWGAFACLLIKQHRRTSVVRMWAEAAYELGKHDCSISDAARAHNKKFSADAVVAAHKGAWDKW